MYVLYAGQASGPFAAGGTVLLNPAPVPPAQPFSTPPPTLVQVPAPPTTYDFTQADGPLPPPWLRGTSWYATSTTLPTVANGRAVCANTGTDSLAYLSDSSFTDSTVAADLGPGAGVVFRYGTNGSGYLLLLDKTGHVIIDRLIPGASDAQLYYGAAANTTPRTFSVQAAGSSLTVYDGTTQLVSLTDATWSAGYVGINFQPSNTAASVDNLSMTPFLPTTDTTPPTIVMALAAR